MDVGYRIERQDGTTDGLGDAVIFASESEAWDAARTAFGRDSASDDGGVEAWLRVVELTTYRITATIDRDGRVLDANQAEVLGEEPISIFLLPGASAGKEFMFREMENECIRLAAAHGFAIWLEWSDDAGAWGVWGRGDGDDDEEDLLGAGMSAIDAYADAMRQLRLWESR